MTRRRADVGRALRKARRLCGEPGFTDTWRDGQAIEDAQRARLQRAAPFSPDAPWRNLRRSWVAWHLNQAAQQRREYAAECAAGKGEAWRWRLRHVRDNVAAARTCNRIGGQLNDYRGLPQ